MWLLILIFLLVTCALGWCFFGYFLVCSHIALSRKWSVPAIPDKLPFVSVIVPCFNEDEEILPKLANLRKLKYPAENLEVIFVDGNSQDATVSLLAKEIKPPEPYKVAISPLQGKIHQINYALTMARGEIIVVTDVDAELAEDALRCMAAEFASDERVMVVGAYCRPKDCVDIEGYYWSAQNKGRFLESEAYSSSIVIAQCYGFRKGFLTAIPDDVVADDVYTAFLAHKSGERVVYSRYAQAWETRCPRTYADFLRHKFRKSNAVLRESLRFVYLLPQMGNFCKMMFLTRVTQQLFLPALIIAWCLVAAGLLSVSRQGTVILAMAALAALFIITHFIFLRVELPDGDRQYPARTVIVGYFLTLAVMLATGATYPFVKQDSSYPRLKEKIS